MKTITALLLMLSSPALADVVLYDNRGPDRFDPYKNLCGIEVGGNDTDAYARLDPTRSPAENIALPCPGTDRGLLRLADTVRIHSCEPSTYHVAFLRASDNVVRNAVVTHMTPVTINPCPEGEGSAWPYYVGYDYDNTELIGPSMLPDDAEWARFTSLTETHTTRPGMIENPPEFVGFRYDIDGQYNFGWLQFSYDNDPNYPTLIAWGYETEPASAVHATPIENARRTPDLNLDEQVDSGDLAVLLASWGTDGNTIIQAGDSAAYPDIDGDGVVGSGDLAELLAGWSAR